MTNRMFSPSAFFGIVEKMLVLLGGASERRTVNERYDATSLSETSGKVWLALGERGESELCEVKMTSCYGETLRVKGESVDARYELVSEMDGDEQIRLVENRGARPMSFWDMISCLLAAERNVRVKCDECGKMYDAEHVATDWGNAESGPRDPGMDVCPPCASGPDDGDRFDSDPAQRPLEMS